MNSPISLRPTWPEVRCDVCHTVYTHPDANAHGMNLIVGKCPKCGGGTFSTVMESAGTFALTKIETKTTNVPFDAQKGAGGICSRHGVYDGRKCPYCSAETGAANSHSEPDA